MCFHSPKVYRLIEANDSQRSGSFLGSDLSDVLAVRVFVYYHHDDSVVKTLCLLSPSVKKKGKWHMQTMTVTPLLGKPLFE